MSQDVYTALVRRLGRRYAEQRLRIEEDHEAQVFGQGINFFHFENWYSSPWLIRNTLRLAGLYRRGLENAGRVSAADLARFEVEIEESSASGAFYWSVVRHAWRARAPG